MKGSYMPLQNVAGQAPFVVIDSLLSEGGGARLRIRLLHGGPRSRS